MFCKYCGQEINNDAIFCPRCGKSLNSTNTSFIENYAEPANSHPTKGLSIASLTLGILGLIAWLLPIIGFPVVIIGLVLGIIGRNGNGKTIATIGITLCVITLILTTANSAIGAYMGPHTRSI